MKKQIKQQVSKFFSFCMALVMVLTSLTITPMVANAEGTGDEPATTKNVSLYFKLPAETSAEGWAFNGYGGITVSENGAGPVKTIGGNYAGSYPTLLSDSEGWGYVSVSINSSEFQDWTGMQFVEVLGEEAGESEVPTSYSCWENEIFESIEAAFYYNTDDRTWYKDKACSETLIEDNGISNTEETAFKVYYLILDDEDIDFSDIAVNPYDGVQLTEAGKYLSITAWNGEKHRTLLDANMRCTVEDWEGKWGYVGLESKNMSGLQFLTVDGGENKWNTAIKELDISAAYYVPGAGWYKDSELETKIEAKTFDPDKMYILGGDVGDNGNANDDALGNWRLDNAIKMDKIADGHFETTITLEAGSYEYLALHDVDYYGWDKAYKNYENNWSNYSITVSENCAVVFTVKNPDTSTGKAEVTAEVKKGNSGGEGPKPEGPKDEPIQDQAKKYTVTFKDGDKVLKTETVEEGKAATAPALPTKTGYTASWDKTVSKVTADTVVTVKWTPNTYTLTYNVNGGSKLKTTTKTITYDSTYGTLVKPKRKGYTFKGWYTAKTKGTKVTSATKVTGNVTIYAQWKKVTKPGKVTVKSVKNSSKKAIKVTLKKVKGADGYEIRYSTKKSMKGAKKVTTKKTTVTIKSLKKGKTYYVQARAYKLDSAGKKVYSSKYSTVKKVKIKK